MKKEREQEEEKDEEKGRKGPPIIFTPPVSTF